MKKNILIVEDESIVAKDICETIAGTGFSTTETISSIEQAIVKLENNKYDLLLIDSSLNDTDSIVDLSLKLSERFSIPVLFLITYEDLEKLKSIYSGTFFNFIIKPFQKEDFLLAVEREIYYHNLKFNLKKNNNLFENILSAFDQAVFILDKDGFVNYMNPSAEHLANYKLSKNEKISFEDICQINPLKTSIVNSFSGKEKRQGELILKKNNNIILETKYYSAPVTNYKYNFENSLFIIEYPDKQINSEEQLKESFEKVLRNTNHRFRNNLQLISSIFNLQAKYVRDETSKEYFIDTQNRMRTMGYINDKLNSASVVGNELLNDYIQKIAINLFHAYKVSPKRVNLKIEIEPITLNIEKLLPLGLIINELVSNSLKHGFKNSAFGELNITLKESSDNILLNVKDTGCGFSNETDFSKSDSLGLQLVCALTTQLEGSIKHSDMAGTDLYISFKN